jgi:hypothetical protein
MMIMKEPFPLVRLLASGAAIWCIADTGEPPAEVVAAGHDRCNVFTH